MSVPSAGVANMNWLLSSFATNTPGVELIVVVSSDGLLMGNSSNLDRASADTLAAVVSGLRSLSDGAGRVIGKGSVSQVIVEMRLGYLLTSSIGGGSSLGVVASKACDLGVVGYEMALLVERVGRQLTPELITELKSCLART